jgi:hypothetical protein
MDLIAGGSQDGRSCGSVELTMMRPRPQVEVEVEGEGEASPLATAPHDRSEATYRNFVRFSIFCAAVPASALACLALATARLGSEVGAWQSGILFATYTLSSVVGLSIYLVQRLGSRKAVILGQAMFGGGYVACFWMAVNVRVVAVAKVFAWVGAGIGGVGAAVFFTAQGVYFAQAAEAHALQSESSREESTSLFAGVFAFWFLVEETILELLSTFLVRICKVPWSAVFALYSMIAILATFCTTTVWVYPRRQDDERSACSVVTATVDLLVSDSKMKYMIGFNAAFGFAGAYLNSFVSGEVVPIVLQDSSYVGLLVALHGGTAAVFSLLFSRCRKGPVLVVGALSFVGVALPFLIQPNVEDAWTWRHLVLVYFLEGVGRATFESTLKAIFADFFPLDKEAAFANITLQNGLASSVAYVLSTRLHCEKGELSSKVRPYCIQYRDGSSHNVGTFASLVVGTSLVAVLGYWRASCLAASTSTVPLEKNDLHVSRRKPSYQSLETAVPAQEEEANSLPEIS